MIKKSVLIVFTLFMVSFLEAKGVPPLKTQQKTVQYLDRLSQQAERLKQVQQEKMQHLKDLKASILDRAFRGEI